jgi:uncharacterized protein YneR
VEVDEGDTLDVRDGDNVRLPVRVGDNVRLTDGVIVRELDTVRDVVTDGVVVKLGVRVDDSEAPALGVPLFEGVWLGVSVEVDEGDTLDVRDGDNVRLPVRVGDNVRLTDGVIVRELDTVREVVTDGVVVKLGVRVDDSEAPALGVPLFEGVWLGVSVEVDEGDTLDVRDGDNVRLPVREGDNVRLTDGVIVRELDTVRDVVTDGVVVKLGVRVDDSEAPALGVPLFEGVWLGVSVEVDEGDTLDVRDGDNVRLPVRVGDNVRLTDGVIVRELDTVREVVTDGVVVKLGVRVDDSEAPELGVPVLDAVWLGVDDSVVLVVRDTVDVPLLLRLPVRDGVTDLLPVRELVVVTVDVGELDWPAIPTWAAINISKRKRISKLTGA